MQAHAEKLLLSTNTQRAGMTRYNGSVFCVLESSFYWKQPLPMPKEWYPCPRETTHKPFERKKKGMCKRAQNCFVHPCIGVVLGVLLTSVKPRVLCQWRPPRSSSAHASTSNRSQQAGGAIIARTSNLDYCNALISPGGSKSMPNLHISPLLAHELHLGLWRLTSLFMTPVRSS